LIIFLNGSFDMVTKIAIAFQISVTGLLRCIRNKFDSVEKEMEREKVRERESEKHKQRKREKEIETYVKS